MHHKAVAQVAALFGRNDLPQGHFHLLRFLDAVHQANFVAQTDAVGVCYDGRFAEHIAHDEVGAFAPHPGQSQKFLKGGGHLAVVLVPQHPHTGGDVPGLGVPQAAGLDDGFNVLRFRRSQGCHIRVFGKQVFHYDVHPGIGALRCQPDADQQLPCVVVIQRAARIRVFFFQPVDHFQRQRFLGGKVFRFLFSGRHIVPLLSTKGLP